MSQDPKAKGIARLTGEKGSSYEHFHYGAFSLEFLRFGEGPRPLLAFHGFGRRAEDYAIFASYLHKDITLYSFNLFGHGRSIYPDERLEKNTLSKVEFAAMIEAFLDQLGAEKAAVLGYSLGGKLALSLLELLPQRIEGAYLFAPDGLTRFHWYRWASRFPPFRKLFRHFIQHPQGLFRTFQFLATLGLIERRTAHFLQHQARTVGQRKAVYSIWNMHRDLGPDLSSLRHRVRQDPDSIRMIFGKRDPVIRPARAWKLLDRNKDAHKVHVLRKGHILLDFQTLDHLSDTRDFDDPLDIF